MSGPRLGLALGSGGARGLAHAGVLQALHEAGIPVGMVAGTSMGALVGALYASDPDPDTLWQHVRTYIEDPDFAGHWDAFVPREGNGRLEGLFDFMHRGRVAVRTMTSLAAESRDSLHGPLTRSFADTPRFEDLVLPFAAVALDLMSGNKVVFREGSLVDALYASCAIPGIFPPVERDDEMIVDGGGPYRVPVEACRESGADFVVAVDIPGYRETNLRSGFDLGMRSNTVARDRLNDFVCASADFVIRPAVQTFHWADFKNGDAIREIGYQSTMNCLPALHKKWGRRRSPLGRLAGHFRRIQHG